MGQQQSKAKLLYQQVKKGNIERIKALRRDGAGLEWVDEQGDTPLMVACKDPKLINVAKTLIELGADVNAAPHNSRGGTPICNAAMRGLDQTVKLLLSHGAIISNPFNCAYSALDIARRWSFGNVVRAIENHTCLFSGLLREVHYPRYLEGVDPPWPSVEIWAVVIYGSRAKLELRIYHSAQDAHPREVILLWEAELEENFHHTEPSLVIFGKSSKTKHRFISASDGDKQQIQYFFSACNGIQQEIHPPAIAQPLTSEDEDMQLAMALSASIQHNVEETRPHRPDTLFISGGSSSGWLDITIGDSIIDRSSVFEAGSSSNNQTESSHLTVVPTTLETASAPAIPEGTEDDQMNYASILLGGHYAPTNVSSIDLATATATDRKPAKTGAVSDDVGGTTSCIICYDAPREGACIPCGHMVGCVSCLNEIKAKKWGCPVCRIEIDGVIRIYDV